MEKNMETRVLLFLCLGEERSVTHRVLRSCSSSSNVRD